MGHDYQEREVTFTREGKKIYGKLFMPDVDGKPPLVIICHGFAGNHEGVLDYAAVFAREGIAAYAFDFIVGGPDIKSDGIMLDMTVLTEARDLDVIIDGFIDQWDSVIMCYLPGSEGGNAIADVLTGDAEFKGTLPMPYYSSVSQIGTGECWLNVGYSAVN